MPKDLPIGCVRFYDFFHPALEAGDYSIEVSDTISVATKQEASLLQNFTVQGPRFSLPAEDIQAMHPAPASIGEYGAQLPFVVMSRKSLPWEHTIVEERNTPWLALLVFSENELELPTGDKVTAENINTRTFVGSVGKILENEEKILKPKLKLTEDIKGSSCASIKMYKSVFERIAPHLSELKYLAHCREINASDKDSPIASLAGKKEKKIAVQFKKPESRSTSLMETKREKKISIIESKSISSTVVTENTPSDFLLEEPVIDHSEWFSVLMANRFPVTPQVLSALVLASEPQPKLQAQKNIVHLVSLEGMSDFLKDIEAKKEDKYKDIELIQLISLASWSFQCLADQPHNFGDLMKIVIEKSSEKTMATEIEVDPKPDPTLKLFRLPTNTEMAIPVEVKDRLDQGYVPLLQTIITGEKTFCWYRGPFTPARIGKLTELPAASRTGSDLVIYDDVQGVFDVTYATAWQIGRMLALADVDWCQALLEYRRKQHNKVALALRATKVKSLLQSRLSEVKGATSKATPLGFLSQTLDTDLRNIQAFTKGLGVARNKSIKLASPKLPKNYHTFVDLQQQFKLIADEADVTPDFEKLLLWLVRLKKLEGVPFYYLVPDEQLLPLEAIRFFYVDPNWLNCLIDGALSIGVHNQFDPMINQKIKDQLTEFKILDPINKIKFHPQDPSIGMLLRSCVVARWPGLRVRTHDYSDGVAVVEKVRWQKLSSNVMLELFSNIPQEIILSEPAEQIRFGVREKESTNAEEMVIDLRHISGKDVGCAIGKELVLNQTGALSLFRDDKDKVIDMIKLVERLSTTELQKELAELQEKEKLEKPEAVSRTKITSAELAIQLVKAPEAVTFSLSSSSSSESLSVALGRNSEEKAAIRSVNRASFFQDKPPKLPKPTFGLDSEISDSEKERFSLDSMHLKSQTKSDLTETLFEL